MKILSFIPHAGLWKLKFPRSVILESLKKNGHEIHEIRCREALNNYCLVMMSKVPHKNLNLFSSREKKEICNDCMNKSDILSKEFKFINIDIEKITNEQDKIINFELSKINKKNYLNYNYNSINIGKFCMSEMILMTKKKSLNLSKNEWDDYLCNVRNSIITIDFLEKLFQKKKYDLIITNNGFYSYMKAAQEVAKKYKIKNLDINNNRNFHKQMNSFLISEKNDVIAYKEILSKWNDLKKFPLDHDQMRSTTKHMNLLISGGSNNEFVENDQLGMKNLNIRNFFEIEKEKKIILVCTSSEDEILSYQFMSEKVSEENILFETQIDWIKSIIEYAKNNQDLHFIIRIHPREYKNYSHSLSSEMYYELLELLKNVPKNISINLPKQKISIYEIAKDIDLVLNSWSSVGKDLALIGLPVITYGKKNLFYPIDLNIPLISNKIDDYFKLIRKSINVGWDYKRIIKAYRWCHLEFDYTSLNLEDSININNLKKQKKKLIFKIIDFFKRLLNKNFYLTNEISNRAKILREEKVLNSLIVNNESIFSIKKTKNYFTADEDEELKYIKIELKELIDLLCKNKDSRFGFVSKIKNFVEKQ
tara:strand:- start:754 stop:2529 length:1776 start_codon:yes stop_codon:yes gene_type:complete